MLKKEGARITDTASRRENCARDLGLTLFSNFDRLVQFVGIHVGV